MITLQFDVNSNPGQFEIDTAFIPPMYSLRLDACHTFTPLETSFTKGIITVEHPPGGNLVVIESKQVNPGQTGVTLEISMANDVDVAGLVLPLVARSLSGGAFWSGNLDTLHAYGRLASALTEVRLFNKTNVDYASPDQVLLGYIKTVSPCLSAGLLQGMTRLTGC